MKEQYINQAIIVLLVTAISVLVTIYQTLPRDGLSADEPATEFCAERVIEDIKVIAIEPRLAGRPGFENGHDLVIGELTALDLIY